MYKYSHSHIYTLWRGCGYSLYISFILHRKECKMYYYVFLYFEYLSIGNIKQTPMLFANFTYSQIYNFKYNVISNIYLIFKRNQTNSSFLYFRPRNVLEIGCLLTFNYTALRILQCRIIWIKLLIKTTSQLLKETQIRANGMRFE